MRTKERRNQGTTEELTPSTNEMNEDTTTGTKGTETTTGNPPGITEGTTLGTTPGITQGIATPGITAQIIARGPGTDQGPVMMT